MYQIGGIEKLDNCSVDILLGLVESLCLVCDLRVIRIVELHAATSVRAIVIDPGTTAFPILMRENLEIKNNMRSTIQAKCRSD
jgi:hypothetical protein